MGLEEQLVVEPGEGNGVSLGGLGVIFKVSSEDTGGTFSVVEHPIDPGILVPPHVHEREDELSYVLEGEIGARVGDRELERLAAGSYLFKPRRVPHAFWNATEAPARLLEIIVPAGFEHFFVELAELIRLGAGSEEIDDAGRRYGHSLHHGWTAELEARYGVRMRG
jgi:quercetin dioxygenase-like cupin family protein